MTLNTAIILLGIMMILTFIGYRDIMSPAFLMLLPWLFAFVLLIDSNLYYEKKSFAYIYIILSICAFQIFYAITYICSKKSQIKDSKQKKIAVYKTMKLNDTIMVVLIFFETCTMLYYYMYLLKGGEINVLYEYIHKMVFAISYILLLHMNTATDNEKKKAKIYLKIQCIPLLISLMLPSNGRASYFIFIIGGLFIYISFNNENVTKILKYIFIVCSVMLSLFIYVAIRKNHIIVTSSIDNFFVEVKNWITHYMSGSIITFSKWLPNWYQDFSFGENSFRIVYAVLERVGFDVQVTSTFFPFIKIGPDYNNIANVYTIFYTFIIDFGFYGGIIIEAFLGFFYARLYIKKDSLRIGWVYLYSIFMYALFMQVFADQYVAITSYYMQMYLWYLIFYKCQLLFVKDFKKIVIVRY